MNAKRTSCSPRRWKQLCTTFKTCKHDRVQESLCSCVAQPSFRMTTISALAANCIIKWNPSPKRPYTQDSQMKTNTLLCYTHHIRYTHSKPTLTNTNPERELYHTFKLKPFEKHVFLKCLWLLYLIKRYVTLYAALLSLSIRNFPYINAFKDYCINALKNKLYHIYKNTTMRD